MTSSADYSDWLDQSGIYLGNYSHAERYQTFEKSVSPEGLNVRIVFDFLQRNRDGVNVAAWRNDDVHESDGGLSYRLERTAEALSAVGAVRAAEAVRTSRNTDPVAQLTANFLSQKRFDPTSMLASLQQAFAAPQAPPAGASDVESRDVIAGMLRDYVERCQAALQADMARHGDPRNAPGFDAVAHGRELERRQADQHSREDEADDAASLAEVVAKADEWVAKYGDATPRKIRSKYSDANELQRKYADRPADGLLPELRAALDGYADVVRRHPAIFAPAPTDDPTLLARLSNLGAYVYSVDGVDGSIEWDRPAGFDCDWTTFSLEILFPEGDAAALSEALDACAGIRRDFPRHLAAMRDELLDSYATGRRELVDHGDGGVSWRYDDGATPESEIVQQAGRGTLVVLAVERDEDTGEIPVEANFAVPWDEEHGLTVELEL